LEPEAEELEKYRQDYQHYDYCGDAHDQLPGNCG